MILEHHALFWFRKGLLASNSNPFFTTRWFKPLIFWSFDQAGELLV